MILRYPEWLALAEPMAKELPEWEKLLEKHRGANDRFFFLNYASRVMRRGAGGVELYKRNRHSTRRRWRSHRL